MAQLASPDERLRAKPMLGQKVVVCTEAYRPPDVLLGEARYGPDLDMWCIGCVAAELVIRRLLFPGSGSRELERELSILQQQLRIMGPPRRDVIGWMSSLPLYNRHAKSLSLDVSAESGSSSAASTGAAASATTKTVALANLLHPPKGWDTCPSQMADFVCRVLQWHPRDRPAAALAILHPFLSSPALSVTISAKQGEHGLGSIAEGSLDEEVLEYLQECSIWEQLQGECVRNSFKPNKCIGADEGARRFKREFVGYIDKDKPPVCTRLNNDTGLQPTQSPRLRRFGKALRRALRPWLQQLTKRLRGKIREARLPSEFLPNAKAFTDEDMADNAFVYVSVQVMKVGEREDGWHTDGGASLLHIGLVIKKEE